MKLSEMALEAAKLYDSNGAINCCDALGIVGVHEGLPRLFQFRFAERIFINEDGAIDDMTSAEIDQFRVFLLLFFAEWLKDQGE